MIITKVKTFFNKLQVKRIYSFLMALVLSITGAFALLSTTINVKNTFTVGNVDIKLYEDDWFDHTAYETNRSIVVINDNNHNDIPDFAENIVSGQKVSKAPYVDNTGSNDALIFLVIKEPYLAKDQIYGKSNKKSILSSKHNKQKMSVTAYAFQNGYNGIMITDVYTEQDRETVWNNLNIDLDGSSHEITPVGAVQKLFTPSDLDEINWSKFGTEYWSDDGNVYTIYAYNKLLKVGEQTEKIFTSIELTSNYFSTQEYTLTTYVNGEYCYSIPYFSDESYITLPVPEGKDSIKWVAENGNIYESTTSNPATVQAKELFTYYVNGEHVIANNKENIRIENLANNSNYTIKLLPKNLTPDTGIFIERGDTVETYVSGLDETDFRHHDTISSVITPSKNKKYSTDTFENYYIWTNGNRASGYDLIPYEQVNNYLYITDTENAICEIEIHDLTKNEIVDVVDLNNPHAVEGYTYLSTGDIIKVKDKTTGNIIEMFKFYRPCDLNHDSDATIEDYDILNSLINSTHVKSTLSAVYRAIEFNDNGILDIGDLNTYKNILNRSYYTASSPSISLTYSGFCRSATNRNYTEYPIRIHANGGKIIKTTSNAQTELESEYVTETYSYANRNAPLYGSEYTYSFEKEGYEFVGFSETPDDTPGNAQASPVYALSAFELSDMGITGSVEECYDVYAIYKEQVTLGEFIEWAWIIYSNNTQVKIVNPANNKQQNITVTLGSYSQINGVEVSLENDDATLVVDEPYIKTIKVGTTDLSSQYRLVGLRFDSDGSYVQPYIDGLDNPESYIDIPFDEDGNVVPTSIVFTADYADRAYEIDEDNYYCFELYPIIAPIN